jgi:hypothetical protein
MQVLASEPNETCTIRTMIKRVPDFLSLTHEDHEHSGKRAGEEMWEQRVRNLKSHDKTPGNVIAEGFVRRIARGRYKLTELGRIRLGHKS